MDSNKVVAAIKQGEPIAWECSIDGKHFVVSEKKKCRYCTPIYGEDTHARAEEIIDAREAEIERLNDEINKMLEDDGGLRARLASAPKDAAAQCIRLARIQFNQSASNYGNHAQWNSALQQVISEIMREFRISE